MHSRGASKLLGAALRDTPVVLIHGARQTGKTTLVRALCDGGKRRYLTLDDGAVLAAAAGNADGFIAGLDGPVVIDEVQRAPGLFLAIKSAVDRERKPGKFLLTGSANVMLLPRISESLAGRMEIIPLWPLSQGEIEDRPEAFVDGLFGKVMPGAGLGKKSGPDLAARIVRGGYPEPVARANDGRRRAWFASYLNAILQRDVRDIASIEGLADFPRLLALLASRVSGLLNYADLSRSLSMPQSTLKRYFALVEATFLVMLVPAWSANLGLRLSKSPKVFLNDTGLAAHLLGLDAARLRGGGNAYGGLLENFVVAELLKQASWSKTRPRLFHFRTVAGREVDLVLEDAAGRIVGIEVKGGSAIGSSDFTGLRALAAAAGEKFVRGIVLYGGAESVPFEKQLTAVPVHALWG